MEYVEGWKPTRTGGRGHTIKSLRLDLKEVEQGRPWNLLPIGFHGVGVGKSYPLPSSLQELEKLAYLPAFPGKLNSGSVYLRRAKNEYKRRLTRKSSLANEVSSHAEKVKRVQENFIAKSEFLRGQMHEARDSVRIEAEKIKAEMAASVSDLYETAKGELGKQLEAAKLGNDYHGEKITAKAVRECYRLILQTVKGLGLPSTDDDEARDTVEKELADAIRGIQETVSIAPGPDGDTEN